MLRMLTATLVLTLALQTPTTIFSAEQLWRSWPDERFVRTPAPCLRPADLDSEFEKLAELYPGTIRVEEIGRSFRDRPIHMIHLGGGPRTVLLWSQMHGDEPSATPALLDIAHFLLFHAEQPEAAAILADLSLLMIPMLNPDGAELYVRRNSQAIDINRDALNLATPEGRILKRIRDEYEPMLGFNLHDQNRRMAVGDSGALATIALLAVAGDPEGTLTPGRLRSQRACAAIVDALTPLVPGGIARFDEDWNPRAFGDNLTAWGTPVVLIESGGAPPEGTLEDLTRFNFVAILTVLRELARNDLQDHDPQVYQKLLRNRRNGWADVVVRRAFIRQPEYGAPYRADLAFNLRRDEREAAGCVSGGESSSQIVEIGDARFLATGRVVNGGGSLLVAPFAAGVEGWKARRWLSAEVLSKLARLGVGTVYWKVPDRKLDDARFVTRQLIGAGRAGLEVVTKPAEMPWLVLNGPPGRAKTNALSDVITALGGDAAVKSSSDTVGLLSWIPPSTPLRPSLRRDRPASFVQLSPATQGRIDIDQARVVSVFIDGLELQGGW
jgi:hypothetical protein